MRLLPQNVERPESTGLLSTRVSSSSSMNASSVDRMPAVKHRPGKAPVASSPSNSQKRARRIAMRVSSEGLPPILASTSR